VREAAITVDVDTLASIYQGIDLRRPGGYTYAELRIGLENLSRFLEEFRIPATLFMVGNDFRIPANHDVIRAVAEQGHEIANHTTTHAQGFRLLNAAGKEAEVAEMERLCEEVTGRRPIGFRSPGWNVGDDALPILARRGYLYDSSVFPSSLNSLLKFLHWKSTSRREPPDRTTLGHMRYMLAPIRPYRAACHTFGRPGEGPLVEFPMTVVPGVRLPFFATFTLATGWGLFHQSYRLIRAAGLPIQYLFHLSDFMDYRHPDLEGQVPSRNGIYIPRALRTPLDEKMDLFRRVVGTIAGDYRFLTLEQWVAQFSVRA
jgi:peptidoglycan-N-acetylglucosamine deacetylase